MGGSPSHPRLQKILSTFESEHHFLVLREVNSCMFYGFIDNRAAKRPTVEDIKRVIGNYHWKHLEKAIHDWRELSGVKCAIGALLVFAVSLLHPGVHLRLLYPGDSLSTFVARVIVEQVPHEYYFTQEVIYPSSIASSWLVLFNVPRTELFLEDVGKIN